MKNAGLVSVTFRQLPPEEIVRLARQAGLSAIEWGSDIHVPETDLQNAEQVRLLTEANGLSVSSYGTYYKLGQGQNFAAYLEAAAVLNAPVMRIWAGVKGSSIVHEYERAEMVREAKAVCRMATGKGIRVDFEYHPNTLTDTKESALRLMQEIGEPNCGLYWQPNFKKSTEENLAAIQLVLPYVHIVHAFFWDKDSKRLHLAEGKEIWKSFMESLGEKTFLLEFVPQDNAVYLPYEANALKEIGEELEK